MKFAFSFRKFICLEPSGKEKTGVNTDRYSERLTGCSHIGAEGQNRTADTRLFRPLLYRLSYLGPGCHYKDKQTSCQGCLFLALLSRAFGVILIVCPIGKGSLSESGRTARWRGLGTGKFHVIVQKIFSCIERGAFRPGKVLSGQSVTLF